MPRPSESTASLMLRASAERRSVEANLWTAKKGASLPEGPLDSLKAMTDRIEDLGKGLVEIAEGRPRSARRSKETFTEEEDSGTPTDPRGSALSYKKPVGSARLEGLKEGIEEDEDDDGSNIEGFDGLTLSGFQSSLPPNPFKY